MAGGKFLDPHKVPMLEGTEGWERMYPYQYQFSNADPLRAEHESRQLWYYDGLHYPEPHYPFDLLWDEAWFLALSQNNTRTFLIPPANGIDHRIVNGYVYITPIAVEDPKEIEARVPIFMKRAGYYYENWDRLFEEWKLKMKDLLAELEAMSFNPLPDIEDESVVFENKGTGSGFHLLRRYNRLIDSGFHCWQYHFEFLNLCYAGFVTHINTCNAIFPNIPIGAITKMVSGMDADVFRPNMELIKLAKLALENGLQDLVLKPLKADELMAEMAKSPAGRDWAAQFEKARHPWFNISTGTGWYHHHRSWNDDLNVPVNSIRMHIQSLQAGKDLERPTERLLQERDNITDEYRSLIQTDEDRESFDQSLGLARRVFPYSEGHIFYVEHWFHSIFWNKVREIGSMLANAGFMADTEDIWLLKRGEIRDALWDLTTAWATGVRPRGPSYWPKEIDWRRGVMEKFQAWSPPPALGVPPEVVNEPFTIVLWGVTDDVLKNWLKGVEAVASDDGGSEELKGVPGSSGTVEGKARVIRTVDQLTLLEEGEILVATTTSPSWAPAFAKIRAAVTDVGGAMCHAAIICREYALPTVVGTGTGTTFIKTGDTIRVDGDQGLVTVLERA